MATKVTSRVLAADAVVRASLGDDAIGSAEIADDAVTGALIADNVALAGNPTTTTQSTSDSSTRLATTAFVQAVVDADINALIDSAPGTLNTLDEIAAALNDDPSFTTTVNNAIALKAPIASPTFTGTPSINHGSTPYFDLKANGTMKGRFYADANQAIIEAVGNSLILKSASTTALTIDSGQNSTFAGNITLGDSTGASINMNDTDTSQEDFAFVLGANHLAMRKGSNSADVMRLDLTNERVGIGTTGPASDLHIHNDSNPQLRITTDENSALAQFAYSDGSGYFLRMGDAANNEDIMLRTYGNSHFNGGNVGIGTSAPGDLLTLKAASTEETMLMFENNSATSIGSISIHPSNGLVIQQKVSGSSVHMMTHDGNEDINLDSDGFIQFEAAGQEKMRITSTGLGIGDQSPQSKLSVADTSAGDGGNIADFIGSDGGQRLLVVNYLCGSDEDRVGLYWENQGIVNMRMWMGDDGCLYSKNSNPGSDNDGNKFVQLASGGVLIGNSAGEDYSGTTGVYIGTNAGVQATSAEKNVVIGDNANSLGVTTGANNVVIGFEAGDDLTSGWSNMLIGKEAGRNITQGTRNICLGSDSGATISTASENVFIGNVAGAACQSGGNVAIGSQCFESGNFSSGNVGVGWSTGEDCTGTRNTLLGAEAARQMTSSDDCTAVGHNAMGEGIATGNKNVAVGRSAMKKLTSGAQNVAVGAEALDALLGGSNNTALGFEAAGKMNSGYDNVAIGRAALLDTTTTEGNVAVGVEALENNTGHSNTAVGKHALRNVGSGIQNTAVGREAGDTISTGHRNVVIGYNADTTYGNSESTIKIGEQFTGDQANHTVSLGNDSGFIHADFLDSGTVTWTGSSDRRLKKNIEDDDLGLTFINELKPVTFEWKDNSEIDPEFLDSKRHKGNDKAGTGIKHGFIAQDVKAAMDTVNNNTFAGWKPDTGDGEGVGMTAFITPLIKAIQELSAEVEQLKKQLKEK